MAGPSLPPPRLEELNVVIEALVLVIHEHAFRRTATTSTDQEHWSKELIRASKYGGGDVGVPGIAHRDCLKSSQHISDTAVPLQGHKI